MKKKSVGRPQTTGRFETREELLERINHLYKNTSLGISAIGRNCGISHTAAAYLLPEALKKT